MGICPCLVLVFQQVLLSVYSSFRLPLMKAEHNDTAYCTDNRTLSEFMIEKVSEIDSGKIEDCQLLQHNMDLLMFFLHCIWLV